MESIGTQFQQARDAKGVTVSQAAAATRIKFQHIESLEADDFSTFAAAAYARGFIKIYAEYLGLDPDPLLRIFNQQNAPEPQRPIYGKADEARPVPVAPSPESTADDPAADREPAAPAQPLPLPSLPILAGAGMGLVVLVLLIALVARRGGDAPGAVTGLEVSLDEPLLVSEPPDPYLALPTP